MEQVAAKQRMKVATKDHMLISTVHFRLHAEMIPLVGFLLLLLCFVATVVFGATVTSIAEELVQGIMGVVMAVVMMTVGIILGRL